MSQKSLSIDGLNKQSTRVIIGSALALVLWSFYSSLTAAGPWSASAITYTLYVFYWVYAIVKRNPLILRLAIIGTVAGLLELVADHYLVDTIQSLVYPSDEPMLWSSPMYMPFAWSNIIVQLSFIGVLLTHKFGLLKACVVLGIAGGMYIPLYEHLANNAGWWFYHYNTAMVLHAPVYVIICEALISLSLPLVISFSEHQKVLKSLFLGMVLGAWIYISAIIAWNMV